MSTESPTRETKLSMMKRKLPPLKIPPIQKPPDPLEIPKEQPNIPENVRRNCGKEPRPQNLVLLWIM